MTEYERLEEQHREMKRAQQRSDNKLLFEVIDNLTAERDALRAKVAAMESQEPVASIYITASGEREIDDWKCDLVAGRHELYLAPGAAPKGSEG